MTKEDRLLRAIFEADENEDIPDNYPDTFLEKASYADYCLRKTLEHLSPTLRCVGRLHTLLIIGNKSEENTLPDIITHYETLMALESLAMVKRDVDDAFAEIQAIFNKTKGAAENVPENNGAE